MNNFYALSDDVKKTVLEQTAIKHIQNRDKYLLNTNHCLM